MSGIKCLLLTVTVLWGLATVAVAQEAKLPPARPIPGITIEDLYPRACVDCHIVYEDVELDARLSTLLKGWLEHVEPELLEKAQAAAPEGVTLEGKHPSVSFAMADIPSACTSCHSKISDDLPPLGRMLHVIHLTGGDANTFLTAFHGECTHCHKLDRATGEWSVPSAPEAQAER